jgi:DNA primase
VYLCFDSDQAGKDGATQAAAQLRKKGITVYTVELPDKDITIYFNRHTPEEFEQLLKAANPASVEQSDSLNKRKQTLYQQEEHGFTVGYATRQYQVKGIQRGDTQLKATIKVSEDVASSKPFELTTIDLYSLEIPPLVRQTLCRSVCRAGSADQGRPGQTAAAGGTVAAGEERAAAHRDQHRG